MKIPLLPALTLRVVGILGLCVLCVLWPGVGESRFLVAGLLFCFVLPLALAVEILLPPARYPWAPPIPDVVSAVAIAAIIPEHWFTIFLMAVMVSLSPTVGRSAVAPRIYLAVAGFLLLGMGFSAAYHGLDDAWVPLMAALVAYPAVISYAFQRAAEYDRMRAETALLDGLRGVSGGLAHQFNNELMTVVGNAELTHEAIDPDHPAREFAEAALVSANRAAELSRKLALFAGGVPTKDGSVDLGNEIELIVRVLEPRWPGGTHFHSNIEGDAPRVGMAREELQSFVVALLLQALDTAGEGSDVELSYSAKEGKPSLRLTTRASGEARARSNDEALEDVRTRLADLGGALTWDRPAQGAFAIEACFPSAADTRSEHRIA